MNIKSFFLFSALVLSFVLVACSSKKPVAKDFVARVNDVYLYKEDLVSVVDDRMPEHISRWVDGELLYQASIENNIHKDKVLNDQVEKFKRNLLGKLFVETFYTDLPEISEKEVRDFYVSHSDEFSRQNEEVKYYHFIFTSKASANSSLKILKNKSNGGARRELFKNQRVETVVSKKGFLVKPLNDALFNSRSKHDIIGPLKVGNLYHLLEVQERYGKNSQIGFDEAYDEIYQRILHRYIMKIKTAILDSLRASAFIQIN